MKVAAEETAAVVIATANNAHKQVKVKAKLN